VVGKIDEAHYYKNKQRVCNIEELSCPTAAQRAEDLALKLQVLGQRRVDEARAAGIPEGRSVRRVATFATGTPIANSLGELWVMQQYLQLNLLQAAGVADLGDWGAAFTGTITTYQSITCWICLLSHVSRAGRYISFQALVCFLLPLFEFVDGGATGERFSGEEFIECIAYRILIARNVKRDGVLFA
jgi:N12 class adenine-specific DNA methylase